MRITKHVKGAAKLKSCESAMQPLSNHAICRKPNQKENKRVAIICIDENGEPWKAPILRVTSHNPNKICINACFVCILLTFLLKIVDSKNI